MFLIRHTGHEDDDVGEDEDEEEDEDEADNAMTLKLLYMQ